MADGRHLGKSKNRHILDTVLPLERFAVKILKKSKSKMAPVAILENRQLAISRPRFDRFRPNLAG